MITRNGKNNLKILKLKENNLLTKLEQHFQLRFLETQVQVYHQTWKPRM
jgi:hypothetical protein